MAAEARSTPRDLDLLTELESDCHRFGFFQALRRLEAEYRDSPRLGESSSVAEDPIRLAQRPSLAFAPATLANFERGVDGRPGRLEVFFFGLFGPNGPLPHHLTEYAHERLRNAKDATLSRFADIFHHRLLSLFYRAWANGQPAVNYDRPATDRFAGYVGALCGLGQPSLRHRGRVADEARLFFAGRLACQTRNAEGLEAFLQGYLGVEVTVDEFVGDWVRLPTTALCRLGTSPDCATLGRTAIAGDRVWDRQHKFRITLGPLTLPAYRAMLPGGPALAELVELVRTYVHDEFDWDLRLVLCGDEVVTVRLGQENALGRTTWLPSAGKRSDADDFLFAPLTATN